MGEMMLELRLSMILSWFEVTELPMINRKSYLPYKSQVARFLVSISVGATF